MPMCLRWPSGTTGRIEESTFHLADYRAFLKENAASIAAFEAARQAAAVRESGASLSGPLRSPDEPWHYRYVPSSP